MEKQVPVESASALIDEKIKELGDWRGKTLAKVREIIHEADPEIVEEQEIARKAGVEMKRYYRKGEVQKYSASILVKGHSFTGLSVVGSFHEQDEIVELSVRIGAKRFYLQPMEKAVFEQLAAKIGDLDLNNPSPAAALAEANILDIGSVKSTDGTSEWDRDWQGLISQDGVNPPKIIERPEITSTPEARRARTFGKVKLSAVITKNGGIQDLKVVKGLGRGLDQRAIDGVKNSWMFLPATKNGEVLETAIALEIEFPPPEK